MVSDMSTCTPYIALCVCGTIQYSVVSLVFDYGEDGKADPSNPNYDSMHRIEYKMAGGIVTGGAGGLVGN